MQCSALPAGPLVALKHNIYVWCRPCEHSIWTHAASGCVGSLPGTAEQPTECVYGIYTWPRTPVNAMQTTGNCDEKECDGKPQTGFGGIEKNSNSTRKGSSTKPSQCTDLQQQRSPCRLHTHSHSCYARRQGGTPALAMAQCLCLVMTSTHPSRRLPLSAA